MGDNGLVCITNTVRGLRPCVIRGAHTDFCDGFEHRWVIDDSLSLVPEPDLSARNGRKYGQPRGIQEWQRMVVAVDGSLWPSFEALEGRRRVMAESQIAEVRIKIGGLLPRECSGCLPRKAEHGLLCWSCWEKTEAAMNMAVDMVTHLASVDRAQQIDGAGIRGASGWVLPVPATWRLADEMLILLGHPEPGLPTDATVWEVEAIVERFFDAIDLDAWVATTSGAEAAVRFYVAMQHAMKQHPMAEYEHKVRNVRCPKCKLRSLLWKPPLAFIPDDAAGKSGQVQVICTNPACGREMDQAAYDEIARIEESIARQARIAKGGVPKPIPPAPNPDDDDVEPVCENDWKARHGDLPPVWRKKKPVTEKCADCGQLTTAGIYDRKPPREEEVTAS